MLHLEETKEKRDLRAMFRGRMLELRDFYYSQRSERISLNAGYDSDDEANYVFTEEKHETILEVDEKVVQSWTD